MNLVGEVLSVFAEENCVSTALFGEVCDACNGGGINLVLMYAVEVMIIGIGILAVIGLMVFGIQYLTAGSNSGQTAKAKGRLRNIIIGLVTYVVLIAFVQFLSPGGIKGLVVTTEDKCPEWKKTDTEVVDYPDPGDNIDISSGGDSGGNGGSSSVSDGGSSVSDGGSSGNGGDNSGSSGNIVMNNDRLEIHFVGVGSAYDDVIIFRTNAGVMLVDGGTAGNKQKNERWSRTDFIYTYLKALDIDNIDYMIGSHMHENHVGAQEHLLDYTDLTIGPAYYPVLPDDCDVKGSSKSLPEKLCNSGAKNAIERAMKNGLDAKKVGPGFSFTLGKMKVYFIGTREEDFPQSFASYAANKTSFVNYIRYGNKTFLLTGDLGNIGSNLSHIMEDAKNYFQIDSLKVDVVKWPHHGNSKPSNAFWKETSPSHIVVPNWNQKKYPEDGALRILGNAITGYKLHKVSVCQYTVLVTDGSNLDVVCNAKPESWVKGGKFENGNWKFF